VNNKLSPSTPPGADFRSSRRIAITASADVLVVGGASSLLVPVLDVLDGCGWIVRYKAGCDAAIEWLNGKRTHVAVVEAGEMWRDLVERLQTAGNCGRIILAARGHLPMADVLSAGVRFAVRVPFDSYDLRWTIATAWREARSDAERYWRALDVPSGDVSGSKRQRLQRSGQWKHISGTGY
jgi:hypothetical protein